jgi:hypothetical protein
LANLPFSPTPLSSGKNPCSELLEFASSVTRGFGDERPDAFCVFLKIHSCACSKAAALSSEAMRRLNDAFARICMERAEQFRTGMIPGDQESRGWKATWEVYKKNRHDYGSVLPMMANAHIVNDLARAIHKMLQAKVKLNKDEYDAFNPAIERCFDEEFSRPPLSKAFKEKFWRTAAKYTRAERVNILILRDKAWAYGHLYQRIDDKNRYLIGLEQ